MDIVETAHFIAEFWTLDCVEHAYETKANGDVSFTEEAQDKYNEVFDKVFNVLTGEEE